MRDCAPAPHEARETDIQPCWFPGLLRARDGHKMRCLKNNRAMFVRRALVYFLLASVLVACSPALEWRSLPLPELGLEASLPCKPERAERSVDLAGQTVQVVMQGCEAAGVTFAIACAKLPEPSTAGAALAHWRAAVLAAAQAQDAKDTAFQPAGALGLPQAVRTSATAMLPDGGAMHLEAAWFARVHQGAVHACHAIAYGKKLPSAVADVFLQALVLR